ncbi:GNAT family N-acetyltransferase [Pseudoduganella armeniaca]|uniref:GNAT family N-acetyltransferase n=1 Tax=Pseudoduganella armeniaca TaxID=2072590 RepID=A0A2R4CF94_9BURK|nr:GNAT family N-acetyltransferase [Pseudoduganella armeniaca]AVR98317.1 GNAT family N-acetyltransferase [Pseudoduganella armeniaca]
MIVLETPRLVLRTLDTEDAPFYLELVNEPSWLEHIGDKGVRTLDDARAHILAGPMQLQRRLGYSLYLVQRRADGVPMGLCGLIRRDTLPDTDIGYALRPAYWGQGYAYEAAAAVLAHARDTLRLPQLYGITSPENGPSNAMLRKLGLQFVELTRLGEETRLTNVYRIGFV